tara:strand:- start:260 stop:466 length:207 start_codon:yes stop_codon:yes gene_type:complete
METIPLNKSSSVKTERVQSARRQKLFSNFIGKAITIKEDSDAGFKPNVVSVERNNAIINTQRLPKLLL